MSLRKAERAANGSTQKAETMPEIAPAPIIHGTAPNFRCARRTTMSMATTLRSQNAGKR